MVTIHIDLATLEKDPIMVKLQVVSQHMELIPQQPENHDPIFIKERRLNRVGTQAEEGLGWVVEVQDVVNNLKE